MCIKKLIVDDSLRKELIVDITSEDSLKQDVAPISFSGHRKKGMVSESEIVFLDQTDQNDYENKSSEEMGLVVLSGKRFSEFLKETISIDAYSGNSVLFFHKNRVLPNTLIDTVLSNLDLSDAESANPESTNLELSHAQSADAGSSNLGSTNLELSNGQPPDAVPSKTVETESSILAPSNTTGSILSANKDCLFELVKKNLGQEYDEKFFNTITDAIKKMSSFEEFVQYPFKICADSLKKELDEHNNQEKWADFLYYYAHFVFEALQLSVWPLFDCISLTVAKGHSVTASFQKNSVIGKYLINLASFIKKYNNSLLVDNPLLRDNPLLGDWFKISCLELCRVVNTNDSFFTQDFCLLVDAQLAPCYTICFILNEIIENQDKFESMKALCSNKDYIKNILTTFIGNDPIIYSIPDVLSAYHAFFKKADESKDFDVKIEFINLLKKLSCFMKKNLEKKSKKISKNNLYRLQQSIKNNVRQFRVLNIKLKNFVEKEKVDKKIDERIKNLKESTVDIIKSFTLISQKEKIDVDYMEYRKMGFLEKIKLFFKKIKRLFLQKVKKNKVFPCLALDRYLNFVSGYEKTYGLKDFLDKGFSFFSLEMKKEIFKKSHYMRRGILYSPEDSYCTNNPYWGPLSLSEYVLPKKTILCTGPVLPSSKMTLEVSALIDSQSWEMLRQKLVALQDHETIDWLRQEEPNGLMLVEQLALENPSFFRTHIKKILHLSVIKIDILLKNIIDRGNESLLECILSYMGVDLFFSNVESACLEEVIQGILCHKFWGAAYFFLVAVKNHRCLISDFVLLKRVSLFAQNLLKNPALVSYELNHFVVCLNDFLESPSQEKEPLCLLDQELKRILIGGTSHELKDFVRREKYYFYYQLLNVPPNHVGRVETPLFRSIRLAIVTRNTEMLEVLFHLADYRLILQCQWSDEAYVSLCDIVMLMEDDNPIKKYILEHSVWDKFHTKYLDLSLSSNNKNSSNKKNIFYNELLSSDKYHIETSIILKLIVNKNWLELEEKIRQRKQSDDSVSWCDCSYLENIPLVERIAEANPVFFRRNANYIFKECSISLLRSVLTHNNESLLSYLFSYFGFRVIDSSDVHLHIIEIIVELSRRHWRGAMYPLLITLKSDFSPTAKSTLINTILENETEIYKNPLAVTEELTFFLEELHLISNKLNKSKDLNKLTADLNAILCKNNIEELKQFVCEESFYFYYTCPVTNGNSLISMKTPLMTTAMQAIETQDLTMLETLHQLAGSRLSLYFSDDQGGYINLRDIAMTMPDDSPIKAYIMNWSIWKKLHTQELSTTDLMQRRIALNTSYGIIDQSRDFLKLQEYEGDSLDFISSDDPEIESVFSAVSEKEETEFLPMLLNISELKPSVWGCVDPKDHYSLLEKIFFYKPFFFRKNIDLLVNLIINSRKLGFIVNNALENKNVTLIDFLSEINMRWLPFVELEDNMTLFSEVLRRGFWDLAFQFLKTTMLINPGSVQNRERYKILAEDASVLSKQLQGDALDHLNAFMICFSQIRYISDSWGMAFPLYVDGQRAQLYSAVRANDLKTIQSYLIRGYYPNYMGVTCNFSGSLAVWAVERGNLTILKMIQSWMPSLGFYCRRKTGKPPQNLLEIAVEEGHFYILKYLYNKPCFTSFHKTFLKKYSGNNKKINNFLKKREAKKRAVCSKTGDP